MSQQTGPTTPATPVRTPRAVADGYVHALAALDPYLALRTGLDTPEGKLADLSPDGLAAVADLARRTLTELDAAENSGQAADAGEQRCGKLLRERLTAELALRDAGEDRRSVLPFNVMTLTAPSASPLLGIRDMIVLMPVDTAEAWQVIGRRMANVPRALEQYRATLTEAIGRGVLCGPRQVGAVLDQLDQLLSGKSPAGWFGDFAAGAPGPVRPEVQASAASAGAAMGEMKDWLGRVYAPAAAGQPDTVGRERYARWVRYWCGTDLDLDEAYAWAWEQFADIEARMREVAQTVLPGSAPLEAMAWLDEHGAAYEGTDAIRAYLQKQIDRTIGDMQGKYFDLAAPLLKVEAMIAPAGASAAAPYYSPPAVDFSRPGRTWLPTGGKDHFPVWRLVDLWFHESVPGHHVQLGQWTYLAKELTVYQSTMGFVAANAEGWAMYAEQFMDELGYYAHDPGIRLGYLNAQMERVQRVIIDIGMHAGPAFPAASPVFAGRPMTPGNAREFYGAYCGLPGDQLDAEIVRYLSLPGQAITYKLGQRVWLAGREAARKAHGDAFDLKAWHMAAISQGSLGLDELAAELAAI
ncbi:DUF885 domain-containing protein [Streptomyces sp. SID3343]|uniref:DUF885 domain-containing protein n=1 Tax=Streptomyces sp. SID3343 TaxID=2690260 RepID=UPI00136EE74B|nr:DUF885 domain-containing protein [Streptomyces sp. SID3343]MYV99334.1 DUF885 family protein [Streptomyces sp. SID3343]